VLCLKLNKGEAVRFFDAQGQEVGLVSFDRPDGHSLNSVRILVDFDKSIKILRDDVIKKNPALAANLTFREQ
jgi:hypothetical protein